MTEAAPHLLDLQAETVTFEAVVPDHEQDPFFGILAERIGVPMARSFTPNQVAALKRGFGEPQKIFRLPVDWRLRSVRQLVAVVIPSRNRRSEAAWRRRQETAGLRSFLEFGLNAALFAALVWGILATMMALIIK
jgi:hypothetical protein